MIGLEEKLLYEVDWRTNELSTIRTIPLLCNCTDKQIEIIEKYSVVAIYSLWEGFVVESFTTYIRELNNLKLTGDKLNLNIITHDIDIKYDLTSERKHFEKKRKFVSEVHKYAKSSVIITTKIPTKSNVNYKVICEILDHFYLEKLPEKEFKKKLDKLLLVRNKVAHGEHSIPVDRDMIQEFTYTVIGTMHEVTNSIVNGFVNKTYLRKTMPTPNAVASAQQIRENEAVTPSGVAEKIN
jgi:predicted transcriptional regulator